MFPIAGSGLLTRNRVSKFGRCFIRSREIFSHQLRPQSKRWSICLKLWQKRKSEKHLPHQQKYLTTKTKNIQTPACLAPQVGRGKLRGGSRVKTSTSASAQPLRCSTGTVYRNLLSSGLGFYRLMWRFHMFCEEWRLIFISPAVCKVEWVWSPSRGAWQLRPRASSRPPPPPRPCSSSTSGPRGWGWASPCPDPGMLWKYFCGTV